VGGGGAGGAPGPCCTAFLLGSALLIALLAPGCAAKHAPKSKTTKERGTPEEVYLAALQKIAKKKYYGARLMLQELLPRIPPDDRDLLPKVQIAIADAYYNDRGLLNYGEALNGYRTFLTYYPEHEMADRAQFMVGMSLFEQALSPDRDQALTLQAIAEFSRVENAFPQSAFATKARDMIKSCQDRLAEHERLVGRFYQRKRAYLAAIDRYRQVLDKYPQYKRTNQVLFDLGQCLLAVGNRPEAGEFFARLEQEDHKGDLATRAKNLLEDFDREQAKARSKERSS
jgi:outer membrane protein assembly factor BamD